MSLQTSARRITLPYPPSANEYWRTFRGRILVSEKARSYKVQVGFRLKALRVKPLPGPVSLVVCLYRPNPKGDLDNYLKILLDAVKGYVFEDDSQVVEIHAQRFDDAASPRVELSVFPAEAA